MKQSQKIIITSWIVLSVLLGFWISKAWGEMIGSQDLISMILLMTVTLPVAAFLLSIPTVILYKIWGR